MRNRQLRHRRVSKVGTVALTTTALSIGLAPSPAHAGVKMHNFYWGYNPGFGPGGVGNVVGFWQRILNVSSNIWGNSNPCLPNDGIYGYGTTVATAAWQAKLGVTPDGIAGTNTLNAAMLYKRPDGQQALKPGTSSGYWSYYTGNWDSATLYYGSYSSGWKWANQSGVGYNTDYSVRTITPPYGGC